MADNPVHYVSTEYFNTLGGWFIKWSRDFYSAHFESLEMIITPGSVPEAVAFKLEFTGGESTTGRVQELQTGLDKARDAFYNCGLALQRMSLDYQNTEDDNSKDVENVRGFVDSLVHDYPKGSEIIPPPPGGYPQPPPGDSNPPPKGS
jgi:hypothetical protein